MPIHDRILRGLSKGVELFGGFAGDIFGQVAQQLPGAIVGGLFGGAPTTIPGISGPVQIGVARAPQQQTFPGVPGPPLGGAVTFGGQPMTLPVSALPGGAPVMQAGLGDVFGGLLGSAFGPSLTPQGATCPTLFRQAPQTLRPVSMFHITNPSTGREVWYRNVGQPVLWSGDFAAVKRVRRVAGKAHRARGSRKR